MKQGRDKGKRSALVRWILFVDIAFLVGYLLIRKAATGEADLLMSLINTAVFGTLLALFLYWRDPAHAKEAWDAFAKVLKRK